MSTTPVIPATLAHCARLLAQARVRHHVDAQDGVIRAVFVTEHYVNLRGERLAIVRIDLPDGGRRCRVSLPRAFSTGARATATCARLCRMAADTPLAGIEYDADGDDLRIVAEMPLGVGRPGRQQLLAMLDAVVTAAEAWHVALITAGRGAA